MCMDESHPHRTPEDGRCHRVHVPSNVSNPSVTWRFFPALEMRPCHPSMTGRPWLLSCTCLSPESFQTQLVSPYRIFLNSSPWLPSPTSTWVPLLVRPQLGGYLCRSTCDSPVYRSPQWLWFCSLCARPYLLDLSDPSPGLVSSWVGTAFFASMASAPSTSLTHSSTLLSTYW